MKSNTRAGSFLCAFFFVAGFGLGDWLGAPQSTAWTSAASGERIGLAVLVLLLFFTIWLYADALLASSQGADSTGLTGTLRWAAWGLFSSLLANIIHVRWISGLDEKNIIHLLYEPFGWLAILSFVFWLIFRQNLWNTPAIRAGSGTMQILGWLLLAAGGVIVTGGLLMAASFSAWGAQIMLPVGFWMVGIGLILLAAVLLAGDRLPKRALMGWGGGGLMFLGIIAALLGFFLAR